MTEPLFVLSPDAVLRRWHDGALLLSNPRVHAHIEVGLDAVRAILAVDAGGKTKAGWIDALSAVQVQPRTAFTNAEGLLANPSGVSPSAGAAVRGERAFDVLEKSWIICDPTARAYEAYLSPKRSLLDNQHLGTFHQNVGRHLLLDLRLKQTWRWWHDQKFSPDGLAVRPGPYTFVQQHFFDRFFGGINMTGLRLLDFACGNGFYSRRFYERGATVVGIDTSPDLIEIARRNHGNSVQFLQPDGPMGAADALDALGDASFDRIYVSDALLFFFHDPQAGASGEAPALELLRRFRRLIVPGGLLYLMEPNGTFWLATHGGGTARPFAMVTEYFRQVYHVAPTSDRVISALGRCGFAVTSLTHPEVDPAVESSNSPMAAYARQFPLWDFYTCVPA